MAATTSNGKLDQSLDEILKTRRSSTRRGGRGNRRGGGGRPAASEAPVGGVQKNTKQAKQTKAVPSAPAALGGGESKIMVSNLPTDIEESQIKDYFSSFEGIGKPKKILMQYGANGKSLGSATIIFTKPDHAAKAMQELDNVRIDNRLLRVEVLVSARNAPAVAPQASLADRVTSKKDKPKPATATKAAAFGGRGRGRGRARGRGREGRGREGRTPRDKKKTVEELDAEMEDYFPVVEGSNNAMVPNGNAVQVNAGDIAMDDEML